MTTLQNTTIKRHECRLQQLNWGFVDVCVCVCVCVCVFVSVSFVLHSESHKKDPLGRRSTQLGLSQCYQNQKDFIDSRGEIACVTAAPICVNDNSNK